MFRLIFAFKKDFFFIFLEPHIDNLKDWSVDTMTTCDGKDVLGGAYANSDPNYKTKDVIIEKTFRLSQDNCEVQIDLKYYAFDSWDSADVKIF